MSALFTPFQFAEDNPLHRRMAQWSQQPWYPAARAIFTAWRDERSPNVCTLAYARWLEAVEEAVAKLRTPVRILGFEQQRKSVVISVPYLSNGEPPHHFRRRFTLADFGLTQ
jgi:hypothetical protein